MANSQVFLAFSLTLLAGLATGIGSALILVTRKTNIRLLALSLGFSAGVMIYVSFVEIFPLAKRYLGNGQGSRRGDFMAVAAFFAGIALTAVIDKLVPQSSNPHEMHDVAEINESSCFSGTMMHVGLLSAIAIAIHNFPEGMATFFSALKSPRLGVVIALAIAIHNIPEGIAVAVPVYFGSCSRRKAFFLSFLSGLSEPVGALLGYLILRPYFTDTLFGILFGVVAGIMVFISLDELLPAAQKYGEHHLSIYGLLSGMGVMALSLLLFNA